MAFPVKLLPPPLRKFFQKKENGPVASERTILLVSDDPEVQRELKFAFPEDVELALVDDAIGAAAFLAKTTPGLVIVSLRTGNAGGVALSREMDMEPRLASVPRLVLLERSQDTWLAKEGGATKVRVAPFEASDLVTDALELL